jgi:hypothetical protein
MPFSLDIPTATSLKVEARLLRQERETAGTPLSQGAALEAVAHQHGYRDWNTARASLPERVATPAQIGERVTGTYLKQPFAGLVIGVKLLSDMQHCQVTVKFDEPVDVVTSTLFSAFRQRVTATLDIHGVSPARTGDGEPQMRLKRA